MREDVVWSSVESDLPFFTSTNFYVAARTVEIRITIRILGTGCGCRSGLVESKKNRKLSDEIHIAEGVRFC